MSIRKPNFLVSLITADNDYQIAQAASAEELAGKLGVGVQVVYAQNDAVLQCTQILKAVHGPPEARPNAVIFQPAGGTALPQVARAAVTAGVGWALLNRDASYIEELQKTAAAPVFAITSDQVEIGRIQGRQMAALLPGGGEVLYIQGPAENSAARERTTGMLETKPANIQTIMLNARWTRESAQGSVRSWLKEITSQEPPIDLVAAQNDAMAMGAHNAFQELKAEDVRDLSLALPFIGCDGLPNTGQAWVRSGLLAATVFIPPNVGQAMEMLADALRNNKQQPARVVTEPVSIPPLQTLTRRKL